MSAQPMDRTLAALEAIYCLVREMDERQQHYLAVLTVLLGRATDVDLVTVREATQITGLPSWTVRRRYGPLEKRLGRKPMVRLSRIYDDVIPMATARAIFARHREELRRAS